MTTRTHQRVARATGTLLLIAALLIGARTLHPMLAAATGNGGMVPELAGDTITGGIGADATRPARATVPVSATFVGTPPSLRPLRSPTPPIRATIPVSATIPGTMSLRPVASTIGAFPATMPALGTIPATAPSMRPIPAATPSPVGYPQSDEWWVTQSYHWSVFVGNVRSNDPDLCGAIGSSTSVQTLWASDGIWIDPSGSVRVAARYPSVQRVVYRLACQRHDAAIAAWVTTYTGTAVATVYVMKIQTGCATPAPAQQGQC